MKLATLLVFSLISLMIFPAYADVTSFTLKDPYYSNDQNFLFSGTEEDGSTTVSVRLTDPAGNSKLLMGISKSDGSFTTIPRPVESFFTIQGIYNATAFTENQPVSNGTSVLIEYDGTRIFLVPDFTLKLQPISTKQATETQELTFTATLTDSSVEDAIFSLEKNPPPGASITNGTGVFSWTPDETQGPGGYVFDIVVRKGGIEDRRTITINVSDVPKTEPKPVPEPEPKPAPKPEPTPAPTPEPTSKIASFVDPNKDPQSYVDRYTNEPNYKNWFDTNFPDRTIYEAVGLENPEPEKTLASFVDPNKDPQSYVDRYNNEEAYKTWFDTNYPDITIHEAVGLDEPGFGICGPGTKLVGDICTIVKASQGGGCLIATAAYGSELAPEVQLLREIRDNKVLSTESGHSFMTGFNTFYYSFSPTIADMERENPAFKEAVKITITPLLATLSVLNHVDIDSEEQMLGYGIGIILMNIGMYFVAPAIIIMKTKKISSRWH